MAKKGIKQSVGWVQKRVESRRGYTPSIETLKKMSEAKSDKKNPFLGKHHSEYSKEKFRKSRAGYRHSLETIEKQRVARLKYYKEHPEEIGRMRGERNPMFGRTGEANPMFGKHLDPNTREMLSRIRKNKYKGDSNPFFGKHHSDLTREKMRAKWHTRSFAQKNNKLELKLQIALMARGMAFSTHEKIVGRPDIFIKPNICVFVDGCYWHGCGCKFDERRGGAHVSYIKTRIKHDAEINNSLVTLGFVVLRFWEHQITENVEKCVNQVIEESNRIVMVNK